MNNFQISLIVAIDINRNIGKDGKLLWHIPEDLSRFKKLTMGKPIIMGRKTYDSIGRPLPGRKNIVITRQNLSLKDVVIVHSLQDALSEAEKENPDEIFIIGGQQIYEQAMGLADRIYLTIVNASFNGDTKFPEYSAFNKIIDEKKMTNDKFEFTFLTLSKQSN